MISDAMVLRSTSLARLEVLKLRFLKPTAMARAKYRLSLFAIIIKGVVALVTCVRPDPYGMWMTPTAISKESLIAKFLCLFWTYPILESMVLGVI